MHEIGTEVLRTHLSYDQETGVFVRRLSGWSTKVGKPTGSPDTTGHLQIRLLGRLYLAHRLAWLYVHGEWPPAQVDHINGIKSDNRLLNLRLATSAQNAQNRRCAQSNNKSSGLLGVSFDKKERKFFGQIFLQGKRKFLGYFDCPDAAHAAYLEAKAELHEYGDIASSHRPQARKEVA